MSAVVSRRRLLVAITAAPFVRPAAADVPASRVKSPPIAAPAVAPDGESVLAGSQSGVSIRGSAEETASLQPDIENIHHLQFARDGKTLVVAGGTPAEFGVIEFYAWPSLERRRRIEAHGDVVYGIDFSADGSRWVTASGDEVCEVYATDEEKPRTRYTKHSRGVLAARFLPDSQTVVSASRDQTLRVWNAVSGESIRTLHNHSRDVRDLALKPRQQGLPMIASASADRTVRFWQPTIGRMVRFIRLPSEPLSIAWSADAETVYAGCRDGKVRAIDPLRVKVTMTRDVDEGWIHSIAVNPKTSQVVVGSSTGKVSLLDL